MQLLNEAKRGNRIEAIVSRMKTLSTSLSNCPVQHMRFIALSATIPNIDDIASKFSNYNFTNFQFFLL